MSLLRSALVTSAAVALSSCGLVEANPHRFEQWGEAVAAIPVSAEEAGLRGMLDAGSPPPTGPRTPMRIEVVEPEVLWHARADGFQAGLRGPLEAAARAGTEAVVQEAVRQVTGEGQPPAQLPAGGLTVQLGAFSSREAAEAAWANLSGQGPLSGLRPEFQSVERDGRTLYRLRAGPVPSDAVTIVCRAAGAGEWCASTARS
ncbi:SPOR domain-containing protein [Brevundimonas sp.]|uniref:SPOR domain-containing protein n=1 Tax=Brevundimonas sp. TaxID=1871086 RepID=UPI0025CE1B3E|nr:SPOR domain-containing protein [Brevundimonas sp.]